MGTVKLRVGAIDWREIEGEVIAIDRKTATYVAVNPTGTLLWPALVAGTTRPALAEKLVERFGISSTAAESDVEAFLNVLAQHDLLDEEP